MASLGDLLRSAPAPEIVRTSIADESIPVVLRRLSLEEEMALKARFPVSDDKNDDEVYRNLMGYAAAAICDDDGAPLYTADTLDAGITALAKLPGAVVLELAQVNRRVQEGKGHLKELQDAVGNSDATPGAASS